MSGPPGTIDLRAGGFDDPRPALYFRADDSCEFLRVPTTTLGPVRSANSTRPMSTAGAAFLPTHYSALVAGYNSSCLPSGYCPTSSSIRLLPEKSWIGPLRL